MGFATAPGVALAVCRTRYAVEPPMLAGERLRDVPFQNTTSSAPKSRKAFHALKASGLYFSIDVGRSFESRQPIRNGQA